MSGIISRICSAMKRSFLKPSSRKETAAPAGPPIVRSTTPQVHRTLRRGKASRCAPWRFSNHHAQPSISTKKACVGERRPFVVLAYCFKKHSRVFVKRLVFIVSKVIAWRPDVSWAACGISWSRSWLPYFPPFLLPILIPLGNRTTK
jgi:hypothetical protein